MTAQALHQYLYRIVPRRLGMLTDGPTAEEAAIVDEHFAYLQRLTEAGVMLFVGRTLTVDEATFGIAVFRAADEEAATAIMNNDPAVAKGIMAATLFPFRIALHNLDPVNLE